MNYLVVGLGNIGDEYARTRHNIGFRVLDALARASNISFQDKRYGFIGEMRLKGQTVCLLKPSTYMNLSGNAVRYWVREKKIPLERLLIVSDDLALPFGTLRMKPGGSEGGHNGLKSITQTLGTNQYPRLRFGIGQAAPENTPKIGDLSGTPRGGTPSPAHRPGGWQVDYVLGDFTEEELARMDERIEKACDAVRAFVLSGIQFAMNNFNGK